MLESLEARKTYAGPSSAGCPARPCSGMPTPNPSIFSEGLDPACNAVTTGPGATALIRIPLGARCTDNERVNETMAPLVEL